MVRKYADVAVLAILGLLGFATATAHLPAPVAVVLGLALFAAPGYAWAAVLVPSGSSPLERTAVGGGLALAVPIFGGLVLFYVGVPLHRASWIDLLAAAALVGAVVLAVVRWRAAPPDPGGQPAKKLAAWHIYTFGAAAVIGIAAITVAVVSAEVQTYPGYTQLSLSPVPGKPKTANLEVTNEQGSTQQYRLVLLRKGKATDSWQLTLATGQRWETVVPYTRASSEGAHLYLLPDLKNPYRNVDNGI